MLEVLYHHAKFGGARISFAAGVAKNVEFFCLFVCLSVQFFAAVFDPISIKLGHVICLGLVVSPIEYRGYATPGGWVTPKNLYC